MVLFGPEMCSVSHISTVLGLSGSPLLILQLPGGKAGCVSLWQCLHVKEVCQRDEYSRNVTWWAHLICPEPCALWTNRIKPGARACPGPWGDTPMLFPPAGLPLAGTPSSSPFSFTAGPSWKKSLEPPSAVRQRNTPTWPDEHALSPRRTLVVGIPARTHTPSRPRSRWHPARR